MRNSDFSRQMEAPMNAYADAVQALKAADPDRDYIVISNAISRDLHQRLSRLLAARIEKKAKCTVFLTTYGGDPDGGYRVARALRHHYPDHLRVAVPSWCKSAGTLVAIAADELAIGDFGELGPLDIQVHKGSELMERSSGLDIVEAMGHVTNHIRLTFHEMLKETRNMGLSTKLSAEFAAQVSSAVATPLFAQIDPLRLGEMQRATRIAFEYGQRLNRYSENLKPGSLQSLINDYPSHSFVIDRKEAAELFHRVQPLNDAEQTFADLIWIHIGSQTDIAEIIEDVVIEANEAGASVTIEGDDDEQAIAEGQDEPSGTGDTARQDEAQRANAPEAGAEGL